MNIFKCLSVVAAGLALSVTTSFAEVEEGFTSLFNGEDLTGWQIVGKRGPGYIVKDGVIVCPADGGGNLFTEKEYSNFILRFDAIVTLIGTNLSPFRGIQDVFLCKVISYQRYFPKKRVDNFIFRRLCICLLINMETLIKVFIYFWI